MNDKDFIPCKFRKLVDGFYMCFAIGCCEPGDMPCECMSDGCFNCCKRKKDANADPPENVIIEK